MLMSLGMFAFSPLVGRAVDRLPGPAPGPPRGPPPPPAPGPGGVALENRAEYVYHGIQTNAGRVSMYPCACTAG